MTALVLLPRDGLFLKDGREWGGGEGGRGGSLAWPMPSTVLGALRTATGRAGESGRVLDAAGWAAIAAATSLARQVTLRRTFGVEWTTAHRMWPVPVDALFLADRVLALDPVDPKTDGLSFEPGTDEAPDPAEGALWYPRLDDQAKPKPRPPWWTEAAFVDWLAAPGAGAVLNSTGSLPRHVRTHVSIEPATQAAEEGRLFAHDVIETIERRCEAGINRFEEWGLLCEFLGANAKFASATLGGDRRIVHVEEVPDTLLSMPPALAEAFRSPTHRLRLVVVGPAAFAAGWLPDGFALRDGLFRGTLPGISGEVILRSAMVPRPSHVSGWDMAKRQPKPTTRLVPPGSVYHVEKTSGPFSTAECTSLWLAALGGRISEGFGRVVPGIWNPAKEQQ
jgi:CRISPR-associated protein Cmr3